ncbi:hypothetical protein Sp245p_18400 (plasmid) [Azospirillum baldaniorum]|uniref:Uncharacterized protein n=1 Tax=Azospirillum baldaniorum TaxID=1064539 RepID=A0A9P1JUP4_9PROT|nr:hypothetical protein [Azospirillum baldaniorum]TWA83332.1 hypothetical protein FBZ85_10173 [Azospirillum brasilense]AWJ91790.1 hypothetical protein Sp245p_18400 [Azospirillum baldaniorum]NUB09878.1 hypothetical protein [Azospirillum baldaniorum]TWA52590.1 hypothetical protein FBZ84_13710 [Azospirillum baldaniorum]CCD00156.1 exported protein of unknown function [Azospirillum baldaniorum]
MSVSRSALLAPFLIAQFATISTYASDHISGYVAHQRWLQAADVAANEQVTHEICGWGFIDLRTPFLQSAVRQGIDALLWDELAQRFDGAIHERRQTEAVLTAHGANAPVQRITGLHATGGCSEAVRKRIQRLASAPSPG